MDMSVRLANNYFGMLNPLSNETKLHLIKMLTDSILNPQVKVAARKEHLEDLFGIWANDAEMDHMETEIRRSRRSNSTRNIISFDE